jgi:hypothetical protein
MAKIPKALSNTRARKAGLVSTIDPLRLSLLFKSDDKLPAHGYPRVNRGLTVGVRLRSYTRARDLGPLA